METTTPAFILFAEHNDMHPYANRDDMNPTFCETMKLYPKKSALMTVLKYMKVNKIETVFSLEQMDTVWVDNEQMKTWNTKQVMVFVCIWHTLYGIKTSNLIDLNSVGFHTGRPLGKSTASNSPIIIARTHHRYEVNIVHGEWNAQETSPWRGQLVDWITATGSKPRKLDSILKELDTSMRVMRSYFKNHCNFPGFKNSEIPELSNSSNKVA